MLHLDRQLIEQPQGYSRYKLNVVRDSVEGSGDVDVGEIGNRVVLSTSDAEVGSIAVGATTTILFFASGKIYMQEGDKFTLLKDLPCFNFSEEYPITGTYRTVRGCERIIYWADGLNRDRYFNLDKPDDFQTCNDFNIAPNLTYPNVVANLAESGGLLEYGGYQFVFEYLDATQNVILRTQPTPILFVGDALNLDTFSEEAGGKPKTTKSILLQLSDIDLRAKFIRVGALTKTSGNGVVYNAHYCGQPIPVSSRNLTYRYVGFNPSNGDFATPFESLIADHVVYTTSTDINQVTSRLLRANLKDGVHDYAAFQRAASAIGTSYLVEDTLVDADIVSEQGDEVKAYGIGFILDDGTRTPVFHIPGPLPTADERRIISSRYGPGDTSGRVLKQIRMTLDVSTKNAPGRDRDVFINYSFSVAIKKVVFKITSGTEVKFLEAVQKNGMVDTEIQGRTGSVSLEINVEDLTGAKYSKVIQFASKIERTSFTMKTSTANLYAPENLQRWVVDNTAVKDATPLGGYSSSGRFGVYESSEVYARPSNYCADESFWGVDYYGNTLEGSKVRYHRVPCRTVEPLVNGRFVRPIGVRFSNISYPSSNIVGHFFASSTYEETNRTIDSAGYILPYNFVDDAGADSKDDTGRYLHYLPNTYDNARPTNNTYQNFVTLQYLIDRKVPRGRFVKTNGYLETSYSDNRPEYKKFFKGREGDLQLFGKHHLVTGFSSAQELNLVESSVSLLSKTINEAIPNRSLTNDFNIVKVFENPIVFNANRANLNYAYMKTGFILFPFVSQIRYRLFGKDNQVASSQLDNFDVFDGDVYISNVDLTNISRIFGENIKNSIFLVLTIGLAGLFLDKEKVNVEYELIEGLVFESPYNFERRFEGAENCAIYYNAYRPIDEVIMRRIADRIDTDGNKDWVLRDSVCMEWYENNPDYNRSDFPKIIYPLSQVFDYCSKCINKHPNDIIYSEVATTEDGVDNFLVYKPNNRVTIPGDGGPITKVDVIGNNIVVRCFSKTYALFPNSQELQVTDATVFLGTGSFLAAPAHSVDATSSGFAGQQHKLSSIVTPFGLVWADQLGGAIYQYDGSGITEISAKGMYHFFEENMKAGPGELQGSVKMAYDPLWKRIVVHSPKFKFIGSENTFSARAGRYYAGDQEIFTHQTGYFENLSFTLSYSMKDGDWQSWHSYMPRFMYHNLTTMFTCSRDGIYAHDNRTQTAMFYGISFPVEVEINYANIQTFQNSAFHYYAKFQKYDAVNKVWVDVPNVNFDRAWAYNDSQSSGSVRLFQPGNAYQQIGWSTTDKRIEIRDMNCRIAELRSISTRIPVVSRSWALRQSNYNNGHGYADKVPVNVEYNTPQHEQVLFRDKVLSLRLSITNPNVRVTYHAGTFANTPSIR